MRARRLVARISATRSEDAWRAMDAVASTGRELLCALFPRAAALPPLARAARELRLDSSGCLAFVFDRRRQLGDRAFASRLVVVAGIAVTDMEFPPLPTTAPGSIPGAEWATVLQLVERGFALWKGVSECLRGGAGQLIRTWTVEVSSFSRRSPVNCMRQYSRTTLKFVCEPG
jgi:hypothetical protein